MVGVAVSYDTPHSLEAAFRRKVENYMVLGRILPLVLGFLGSWHPRYEEIRTLLNTDGRSWGAYRRKARIAAMRGLMKIIRDHLASDPAVIPGPCPEVEE